MECVSLLLGLALGGGLLCRRLLGVRLGAGLWRRLRRCLGSRLPGRRLFLRGLLRRLGVLALGGDCRDRLFLLRPGSDRRLLIIGQDLGDPQHRDLVAITALAARILAAALLERDDLGAALVLQHFGCDRSARDRGRAKHRLLAAEQENFAKLHDRTDIAGDLAYLEHIIRNDAVLPAAGFDDCEHRLIPSCSIPASDRSGPAFSSVVMGSISAQSGSDPSSRAKISGARKIPRRVAGLIARSRPESRQSTPKTGQMKGIWRVFGFSEPAAAASRAGLWH